MEYSIFFNHTLLQPKSFFIVVFFFLLFHVSSDALAGNMAKNCGDKVDGIYWQHDPSVTEFVAKFMNR